MSSKRNLHIVLPVIVSVLVSCHVARIPVETSSGNGSASDYINTYSNLAISEMKRTGIPASITLAQGLIESGMGKSRLAIEANNHFGIKCHDDWTGPTIRHNDDRRNECFRKYRSPAESFRDHSDFLVGQVRYKSLFDLDPTDYEGWAKGLKKAGYATNPDYANMLIRKIREYDLHRYDLQNIRSGSRNDSQTIRDDKPVNNDTGQLTRGNESLPQSVEMPVSVDVLENNRIQYIVVNGGDTRESIEKVHKLLHWELPKYNELPDDFMPDPGQLLYLQPKRKKAEPGKETHIATEGQTMYQISQIYGIWLKDLYILNRMEEGSEPENGQKIYLRKVRPVF